MKLVSDYGIEKTKRPRKCKSCKVKIPSNTSCFIREIPTMKHPKGFRIYGKASYCSSCVFDSASGMLELVKDELEKLKSRAKQAVHGEHIEKKIKI